MNHDATHCADYNSTACPKSCYRAQLTEESRNICYSLPTSWAHFKGTNECPRYQKNEAKKAKISIHGTTDWNTRCRCPSCNKDLFDGQKYCSECGQKIDWGDKK